LFHAKVSNLRKIVIEYKSYAMFWQAAFSHEEGRMVQFDFAQQIERSLVEKQNRCAVRKKLVQLGAECFM